MRRKKRRVASKSGREPTADPAPKPAAEPAAEPAPEPVPEPEQLQEPKVDRPAEAAEAAEGQVGFSRESPGQEGHRAPRFDTSLHGHPEIAPHHGAIW